MESYSAPAYPNGSAAFDGRTQSVTVTFTDWLLTFLISIIPFVNIIMLFVWAFSASTPPSKANWAKAILALYAIFMVLGFLFAGSLAAFFAAINHRGAY